MGGHDLDRVAVEVVGAEEHVVSWWLAAGDHDPSDGSADVGAAVAVEDRVDGQDLGSFGWDSCRWVARMNTETAGGFAGAPAAADAAMVASPTTAAAAITTTAARRVCCLACMG